MFFLLFWLDWTKEFYSWQPNVIFIYFMIRSPPIVDLHIFDVSVVFSWRWTFEMGPFAWTVQFIIVFFQVDQFPAIVIIGSNHFPCFWMKSARRVVNCLDCVRCQIYFSLNLPLWSFINNLWRNVLGVL